MAVQSLSLLTEQAGQTKVGDLQVTRGADEEVRRLQVLHTHTHTHRNRERGQHLIEDHVRVCVSEGWKAHPVHDVVVMQEGHALQQHHHVTFDLSGGQRALRVPNDL